MKFDGFLDTQYRPSAYSVDVQVARNFYTEAVESGKGKSPFALLRTPGRKLFCDPGLGNGTVWGMFAADGHLYATVNNRFVEIFGNGTCQVYPTNISVDGRPARFAGNPTQLFFTQGGNGYIVQQASVTQAAQLVVPVRGAAEIDGYFFTARDGTPNFQTSTLNDGTSWPATNVQSAGSGPLGVLGLGNIGNELWALTESTSTPFEDSGALYTPFQPEQFVIIPRGLWASDSMTNVGGEWYFVEGNGKPGMVMRISAYRANRVSDHSIENTIRTMPDGGRDGVGWTYEENGHVFYAVYFATAKKTLVYDLSVNKWHEMSWLNNGEELAHRAYSSAQCFGKVLVGDRLDGKIYEMSISYLDDAGDLIQRTRIAPCIDQELIGITHSNFTLDGNMGLGLGASLDPDDPNYDPQAMLQWSNDNGKAWGNEHWRGFGAIGDYRRRAIWRRLGYARRRVYRLKVTAPVDWGFAGCYINMKGATSNATS